MCASGACCSPTAVMEPLKGLHIGASSQWRGGAGGRWAPGPLIIEHKRSKDSLVPLRVSL